MKITTRITLVLIIAFMVAGCKQEVKRFNFQPNTMDYFSYKNNAKWVYKLSIDKSYDTVTSANYASGFADRAEGEAQVLSNTLNGQLHERMVIRAEAIPTQNSDRIAILTMVNGLFVQGPVLINVGGTLNAENGSTAEILTTLNVNGTVYSDVLEVTLKAHTIYKQLWFARNVGIIKKSYLNDDTYNLIEFTPGN